MYKELGVIISLLLFSGLLYGQDGDEFVYQTFKDTRIVNTQSIETLPAGKLDFRVVHRFGDLVGAAGGWKTFYGLENASDQMIGFNYGMTNDVMIGINRAKGTGPLRQNVSIFSKVRLMKQKVDSNQPISVSVLGMGTISTMERTPNQGVLSFFEKFEHRLSYHLQVLMAKKFSPYFSLQLGGAWTFRNIVAFNDLNDLASVSASTRINLSKAFGMVLDANYPFSALRTAENGYYPILGIGLEWETGGGHVFVVNITNARGIIETDYLPYTRSNWMEGQYRLGFTIARLFSL